MDPLFLIYYLFDYLRCIYLDLYIRLWRSSGLRCGLIERDVSSSERRLRSLCRSWIYHENLKWKIKYLELDIFYLYSRLFHRVSVSERHRSVFQTLMIYGDTVWCSDFILSAVGFTDISAVIEFAHILFG